MKKKLLIFSLCLYQLNPAIGQNMLMGSGARAYSLGGLSVAAADAWSTFNNASAMPFYGKSAVVLQAENRFGMTQLSRAAVGGNFKINEVFIGGTLHYEGYSLYNRHTFGASLARKLSKSLSLGLHMNLNGVQVSGYGSQYRLSGTLAVLARPTKDLSIGLNFENLTRQAWTDNEEFSQYIPAVARLGAEYNVQENVIVAAEFLQELDQPLMIKGGVEYGFEKVFFARAGFSTVTNSFNFGFGYRRQDWSLDFGAGIHQFLGFSPRLSMQWEL